MTALAACGAVACGGSEAPSAESRAARLAQELAAAERCRRRDALVAEQRRADLEQDVADLRGLVAALVAAEPALRPLVDDATALAAPVDLARSVELAGENRRLAQELRRLEAENLRLCEERARLAAQLAAAERERRRVALLAAEAEAELRELRRPPSPPLTARVVAIAPAPPDSSRSDVPNGAASLLAALSPQWPAPARTFRHRRAHSFPGPRAMAELRAAPEPADRFGIMSPPAAVVLPMVSETSPVSAETCADAANLRLPAASDARSPGRLRRLSMSDVLSSLSADSGSPTTEVETERVLAAPEPLVASLLALQGALQAEIHGQLAEWRREFSSHAEEQRRLLSEHCRQVLEELAKHSRAGRGGDSSSSCPFQDSSAAGSSLEDEALCDTAPRKPALFCMSPLKLAQRVSGDLPPGAAEAPEALARKIASEYVADMLRRVQQEPVVPRTPLVRRRRSSAIDGDGLRGAAVQSPEMRLPPSASPPRRVRHAASSRASSLSRASSFEDFGGTQRRWSGSLLERGPSSPTAELLPGSAAGTPRAGSAVLESLTPRLSTPNARHASLMSGLSVVSEGSMAHQLSLIPEPPCAPPRQLVEALFVLQVQQPDVPTVRLRWPKELEGSSLEAAIVGNGFCPDPAAFEKADPAGFGAEPFVFSLLETTVDPRGDASGVVYGCVCGGDPHSHVDPMAATTSSSEPVSLGGFVRDAIKRRRGQTVASPSKVSNSASWCVLCLVSKLPLFSLWFDLLGIVRKDPQSAGLLLQRVNTIGVVESLVTEGVSLAGFLAERGALKLNPPRPIDCSWDELAAARPDMPMGLVARTKARWQAAWALKGLMLRWENLVGDTLASLLACVLLEQKVLLLGDVPRASMMALLLRASIWPFRWMHLFLSAPPPKELLKMPLLEAMFPMIITLSEFPKEWGYRTQYELPTEVVTGMLKHGFVHSSAELVTSGGLRGADIKLPAGRHKTFLKQIAQAKQRLRKGEFNIDRAVEFVQDAMEGEVRRFADVVRSYAAHQVALVSSADAPQELEASSVQSFCERCIRRASEPDAFDQWLKASSGVDLSSKQTQAFFQSFFQTQLFLDLLNEQVSALVAERLERQLPKPAAGDG